MIIHSNYSLRKILQFGAASFAGGYRNSGTLKCFGKIEKFIVTCHSESKKKYQLCTVLFQRKSVPKQRLSALIFSEP